MKRLENTESKVILILLLVSQLAVFRFVPNVQSETHESADTVFADIPINYTKIWQKINQHSLWDLEWYNSTALQWISVKPDLNIQKAYPNETLCKITLIFDASHAGNYRLTFAVDARVREYVQKLDKFQYELTYDDYVLIFDWSDIIDIPNLLISHGLTEVDGEEYFWFRIRRDNIPLGYHIEIDPTVSFSTASMTSIHTCPLDERTFAVVYSDDTNDDVSFQIYDTNGTQILAETDADTTAGITLFTSVSVSAFNSTTFVIGWHDTVTDTTNDSATFAVYDSAGTLLTGPIEADDNVAVCYSVSVSCFNSTHFVIAWYDDVDKDVTFSVYDSNGSLKSGPTDVDATAGDCYTASVSCFNSTCFVIGWNDRTDGDATFSVYDSTGTLLTGPIDADTDIGDSSRSVSVSTFNSTHFAIGWFDSTDQDATFAVYDSSGTLKTGPTDADTTAGTGCISVQVSALNSTAFIISWYDSVDYDLTFATYLSDGTAVCAETDIESWPTAANTPFRYQSPCSQESATSIEIYNDNWIIAYANTTTQADWKAFMPNGTAWDGSVPSTDQFTVTLNSPTDSSGQQSLEATFNYTPLSVGDNIQNASLWIDVDGTWQSVLANETAVQNNTANSFSYTFHSTGTYRSIDLE